MLTRNGRKKYASSTFCRWCGSVGIISLEPSVCTVKVCSWMSSLRPLFSARRMHLSPHIGGELRPQARDFEYLSSMFMSNWKTKCEIDRQFSVASAVTWGFHWTIVVRRELGQKAKLSIYQLIYVSGIPCLACCCHYPISVMQKIIDGCMDGWMGMWKKCWACKWEQTDQKIGGFSQKLDAYL